MSRKKASNNGIETKQRILLAAAELFTERGYNRVSVREICEAVGVGKPTIYYYFKDKEALFVALVDESNRLGTEIFNKLHRDDFSWSEKLHVLLNVHVQFLQQHPTFVRFFALTTFMSLPPAIEKKVRPDKDEAMLYALEVLREGQEKGELDPKININMLAITMLGSLRYLVIYDTKTKKARHQIADLFEELFRFWRKSLLISKSAHSS